MPTIYVGRTTHYSGKRLMDMLCRLKNFGVGRIVYRNQFKQRYSEPCFYMINKTDPDMANPSSKNKDRNTNTKIFATKVFNGKDIGESRLDAHWKCDWRLVPKAEEHKFIKYIGVKAETHANNLIEDYVPFPPLLEHMLIEKQKKDNIKPNEVPKLKLIIHDGINNMARLRSTAESVN